MSNNKKKLNFGGIIKLLLQHKFFFSVLVILEVFYVVATCMFPIFLKYIMDDFGKLFSTQDNKWFWNLTYLSISALCIAIFSYLSNALTQIFGVIIDTRIAKKIRNDIGNKFNRLPLKYYDKNSIGNTLSHITNDTANVEENMTLSVFTLFQGILMLVGILIAMFITSWQLALACLVALPVGFITMGIIVKFAKRHFKEQQENLGSLNGKVEETFTGCEIVNLFNMQKKEDSFFDAYNQKLTKSNKKSSFFGGLFMGVFSLTSNIGYAIVVLVVALLALYGGTNWYSWIVLFPSFALFVSLINVPLSNFGQGMQNIQLLSASYNRIDAFLKEPEQSIDKTNIKIKKVKGAITFKNVEFSYNENNPIINNFSINIPAGSKVAIVGPTGAGKTTIVNLLMRFYEINKGQITIDGVDTKKMNREYLTSLFAMVLQDPWVFNASVEDNIKYTSNVKTDEIHKICKQTNLDHIIESLQHGYKTILGDNNNLSSGEKQLLTIVRALVRNSPLIILDEATSNTDTQTELIIQQSMEKLTKGKTSFVIAHRLSTIKNSDIIIVLNHGDIVETGNHTQLLKKNGFYAKLYNSQFSEND